MGVKTAKIVSFFSIFFVFQLPLLGQFEKGQFYGSARIAANFCQIDGDGASGFNKFGMEVGYHVGQGLGAAKMGGWSYMTGASFAVRGSRRAFDPQNPALQSFHFVYQMIDLPIILVRHYQKFEIGLGVRSSYLLKAEDKEGYVLNLQQDMKKINVLGVFMLSYPLTKNLRAVAESQYSLNSIRSASSTINPLFRTGVYHNVISVGLKFGLSSNE